MDKKNTTIGVLLLLSAVALMFWNAKNAPVQAVASDPVTISAPAVPAVQVAPEAAKPEETPAVPVTREEKTWTLSNGVIALEISSKDGAVKTVKMLRQPTSLEDESPVIFNRDMPVPALQLATAAVSNGVPVALGVDFEPVSQTASEIVLTGTKNGLEYTRIYKLSQNPDGRGAADPYLIGHDLKIRRVSGSPTAFPLLISTGALPATEGDRANLFLNASWYADGDYEKCKIDIFKDSNGFLGFGAHRAANSFRQPLNPKDDPLSYVATTNQYFASVLAFNGPARKAVSQVWAFPQRVPEDQRIHDVDLIAQAYAQVDVGALPLNASMNLSMPYFVGPKEYTRLADLESEIEGISEVVQFTNLFGFISIDWLCKILVWAMNALHDLLPAWSVWSWGWAIVIMTFIVKGITWPLTMAQQRSAKKMQLVAEPMKAIREKYKDNPQKMQQETMKLYREKGINPLAGCLPIFIQIPIFFAMYCAFQTCAELRLQGFLWISDLSMPDTIPGLENFEIFGISLHLLPILMGVTMLVNMLLMPMTSAQPSQKNMFYAMAVFFPLIVYTMPSALTLYWTLQNILTGIQTLIVRKQRLAAAPAGTTASGDVKNPKVDIIPPKRKGRGKNIPR
ncbi:MAG: membrane protein insertase YidC [Opitutales bacterium]|nr:membrane protein insertase YidC [Opitutales bacterium]